jgi:hypothetical protein
MGLDEPVGEVVSGVGAAAGEQANRGIACEENLRVGVELVVEPEPGHGRLLDFLSSS